jgi:prophage regulatory protein
VNPTASSATGARATSAAHDAPAAAVPAVSERALRLPGVLAMVGLGRTAVLDRVRRGEFPQPFRVGRACLWNESSVTAWLREQARRDAGAQR